MHLDLMLLDGLHRPGSDDDVRGVSDGRCFPWLLPANATAAQGAGGQKQARHLPGATDGHSVHIPGRHHRVPADRGPRARMVLLVGRAKRKVPRLGRHSHGSPRDRLQFRRGELKGFGFCIYRYYSYICIYCRFN